MSKVFLIEKAWIDPMENRNASGYDFHSYMTSEEEAKTFCESKGCYTSNDCWEVKYSYGGKMPKYRYTELNQNKDESK
jgi:hypothetical protein